MILGLSCIDIETIEKDNPLNVSTCLSKALEYWVKQNYNTEKFGLPSWRTLLRAVAQVNKGLFRRLASGHHHTISRNYI